MKTKTAIKTNGNGTKVAYSYRRFSSRNPQQRDGTSLQRQLEMAQEVCADKGWKLLDIPPDKSVSGWKITDLDGQQAANFHKGALGIFLAKVRAGEIQGGSVLIIEKMDRFSRNYVDLVLPHFLDLMHAGIELYSCADNTHYTLADIRTDRYLLHRLLDHLAYANEESAGKSDRIGKAFKIKLALAASGKKVNLGSWQPRWIDFHGKKGEAGTYTFNAYAKTVKRIVLDYIDGKSINKIAKALIAEKETSAQGGKWGSGTIASILHNTALTGSVTIKSTRLEHFYEPLIDATQWNQLQTKLDDNKDKKGGNPKTDYIANLFRNRVKCVCGGSVRAEHDFYRCRNREIGTCKNKGSLPIDAIEEDFFGLFLQEQPEALLGKHIPKHNREIERLKTRLAEIEKDIADATNLLGKLPISQLEAKLTALVQEQEPLKGELEAATHKMLSATNAPNAFADIKAAVLKLDKAKTKQAEGEAMYNFDQAARVLMEQLADNETRKKLLALLPSLVQRLEMDFANSQYRIVNASGEVSAWRHIVKMDAMLTLKQ